MEKYRYKVVSREEDEYTLTVKLEGVDDALCPAARLKIEFRKFDAGSLEVNPRTHPRYPSKGFEIGSFVEVGASS